jgi:hypothetical protein
MSQGKALHFNRSTAENGGLGPEQTLIVHRAWMHSVSQAGTLPKELSRQLPMLRIRDVYPRSRILIFSHPGSRIQKTATKERGEKKFVVITFYVAINFTKLQIISVLNCWRKKYGPIFKEF